MGAIERWAAQSAARTLAWLKSNPNFRNLYSTLTYDEKNRNAFAQVDLQERMLADDVRYDAYQRAIARHVREGDIVLDVGTGSGILSFLASVQGPRTIFAIDHSPIIEVAKFIADRNGVSNIKFENVNSKDFQASEKVDIIIHEQIGDYLFSENMVASIVDLRERVLKKGGKILPAKFDLYLEPVQIKDEYRIPFLWEHKFQDIDYGCVRDFLREKNRDAHPSRGIQSHEVDHLLCEPERLFSCDLNTMSETDLPKEFHSRKRVHRDGRLDGYCLYFSVIFDGEISFSTFPSFKRTHWSIPLFRVESRSCKKGDPLGFKLKIGDITNSNTWILQPRD